MLISQYNAIGLELDFLIVVLYCTSKDFPVFVYTLTETMLFKRSLKMLCN